MMEFEVNIFYPRINCFVTNAQNKLSNRFNDFVPEKNDFDKRFAIVLFGKRMYLIGFLMKIHKKDLFD